MRTISSRTSVGELTGSMNRLAPLGGGGKMPPYFPPAVNKDCAYEFNSVGEILLPLNATSFVVSGAPAVQPLMAWPAARNWAWTAGETEQEKGACRPVRVGACDEKSPP